MQELKGRNNKSLATPVYADTIDSDMLFIDIRDEEDYAKTHILDSINLPNPFDVYQFIKSHSDKKCVLVCYSGHTASIMGSELVQEGLENVYFYDDKFSTLQDSKLILESK